MWGIGRYLEDMASRVTCQVAKPDAVQEMARRWMSDVTISAATVLDEVPTDLQRGSKYRDLIIMLGLFPHLSVPKEIMRLLTSPNHALLKSRSKIVFTNLL
ncbi:6865_t:CDS:2, partial [Acaulospora colombiana]